MLHRYLVLTIVATCALTTSVRAAEERTLASVAAADGFTYAWLPTESAVVLTRPGVRIVLRPGRLFYEVNNATPVADRAPTFNGTDLLISPALADRLYDVSRQYSNPTPPRANVSVPTAAALSPAVVKPLTIALKEIVGRTALLLTGTATPNSSVAIELTSEISKDLPIILIRRTTVLVNASGSYSIEMSYGPDAHKHSTITASATSVAIAEPAIAHVVIDGTPTGVTSSMLDEWPKN